MPHNATPAIVRAGLRLFFAAGMALYAQLAYSQSTSPELRVLHSEPLTLEWSDATESDPASIQNSTRKQSAGVRSESPTTRKLRFDAYGRRFDLDLSGNDKWPQFAKARVATAQTYRGQLSARNDSWVRLTQVGSATHGLIWDGEQLFAVAPAKEVNAGADGTVIFRLADTVNDGTEFCSAHAADNGAQLYSAVQDDARKAAASMPDSLPQSLQLKLSVLIDAAFRAQYANDAAAIDAVIVRLNNVDGIFNSQFGAEVDAASIELAEASAPVSDSLDAGTLLRSVAARRASSPQLYTTGITHLITGRDLNGTVVGLAYLDQVCDGSYGAVLSESRTRGAWFDSLVMAHELGHSFGAPHDGEGGACADTPKTFLMSPYINGSTRFSHCSESVLQHRLQTASCLTPVVKADMSVTPSLGASSYAVDSTAQHSIAIGNRGGTAAQQVEVEITIPPALTVLDASFNGGYGGACTVGAGVVSCSAATIAANSNSTIAISLRGSQLGSYSISASVSAFSDADPTNNAGSGHIAIEAQTAATTATPVVSSSSAVISEPATAASGGGALRLDFLLLLLTGLLRRPRRRITQ